MPRTSVVKNIEEAFLYGIVNPYVGNGLIQVATQQLVAVTYDNRLVSQFVVGETVTSTTKSAIVVVDQDLGGNTGILTINHFDEEFVNNDTMTGGTSGTTADVNGPPNYAPSRITRDADDVFVDADDQVIVRAVHAVEGSLADTVVSVAREIDYTGKAGGPYQADETVHESGGTGSDLVINGGFATDTDWTKGTGWTIAAGVASHATGTLSFLQENVAHLVVGERYLITFDVLNRTAGSVTPFAGSAGSGTSRSSNGTFAEEITCAGDGVLQFEGDGAFVGDIDNVTAFILAKAVVVIDSNSSPTDPGVLTLKSIVGTWVGGQTITGVTSTATASGVTFSDRQATFLEGETPDEAQKVTVSGAALSPTLITGGTDGNKFEILRGLPTFGATDYVAFVTGKTGEEGDMTFEARDKGILQHRKRRHDIERRLTVNVSYLHDKEILSSLLDQDAILILERDDDRQGTVTEQHFFLQARSNGKAMPNESEGGDISGLSIDFRFERTYTLAG